ncbi:luciferase family protein [Kitasatospora sp. DSM 101779]|uniref:luciferase domain-containing protein n=1 Tax=Kitasatospora sp. DSM 101779 TaxID=2853165 RepID=UPI0021DB3A70|nr:luciferase family protein [Kitasatospora sp. DSM 101779]MCU7822162.1 hypothetical protein [Kitasatospora sp. DSM 101779]
MPLPVRTGPRPLVSVEPPVEQITQCGPAPLRAALEQLLGALPGVRLGPSFDCVPGSAAGHVSPTLAHGPAEAFLAVTEFGHLHPPYDGSLHLMLPPALAAEVVGSGWGTPGAPTGSVLVYGPRDEREAEVARQLLLASYHWACGRDTAGEHGGAEGVRSR